MTRPFDLWGQRGWCAQEVVGESDFAAEIRSLFGPGFDPEGSEITVQAQLIPDPTNRFDPDAVKVLCSGQQVGYLPREHAGEYAPVLAALLEQGWTPQVQAEVWAQERQDPADPGRRTFVGAVRLDLREPHMIVPVNRPPAERHAVLPTGRMVPVTGDERQLAHLGSLMGEHPESWVYVTLHEQGPTRSPRPLVEVRLDGVPAGTLSPEASIETVPVLTRLHELGMTAAARAVLQGNQVRAELTVNMSKANELPEAWLVTPPSATGTTSTQPAGPSTPASGAPHAPAGQHLGQSATPGQHEPGGQQMSGGQHAAAGGTAAPQWRFVAPPGWPQPPVGWMPPQGWQPDPSWPAPPEGWQFWAQD